MEWLMKQFYKLITLIFMKTFSRVRFTREPATQNSFLNKTMESKTPLNIDLSFSISEYENIKLGFIPNSMEQRWFIYFENSWLYIHRSWTGELFYQLRFEKVDTKYKVVETYVNQAYKSSQEEDSMLIEKIINDALL